MSDAKQSRDEKRRIEKTGGEFSLDKEMLPSAAGQAYGYRSGGAWVATYCTVTITLFDSAAFQS